jgi:predicted transcriptional regulator with HTH domain
MIRLRSKLRRALLTHYLVNRSASHYVRELAALLRVDPTNLYGRTSVATSGFHCFLGILVLGNFSAYVQN